MNVVAMQAPSAQTLLRLGRVSNLPTVWTNVIAGATIANTAANIIDIALIGLAMTAFYVGGMYLNDFFDRDIDARERPGRPIHAGDISAGAVSAIGFILLAVGVVLLVRFGLLTVIWGLALAGAIVLYDAWHKGNVFAPVIMGLCRAFVYLATGAAVSGEIRVALIAGAVALAAHVIGLTYAAKQENLNQVDRLWPLAILAGPLLFALPGLSTGWLVARWWYGSIPYRYIPESCVHASERNLSRSSPRSPGRRWATESSSAGPAVSQWMRSRARRSHRCRWAADSVERPR